MQSVELAMQAAMHGDLSLRSGLSASCRQAWLQYSAAGWLQQLTEVDRHSSEFTRTTDMGAFRADCPSAIAFTIFRKSVSAIAGACVCNIRAWREQVTYGTCITCRSKLWTSHDLLRSVH